MSTYRLMQALTVEMLAALILQLIGYLWSINPVLAAAVVAVLFLTAGIFVLFHGRRQTYDKGEVSNIGGKQIAV